MTEFKLAVIVGSLRKESFNLKLAKAVIKLGEGKFRASFVRFDDLPLYNQDLEVDFPAPATRMKSEIEKADAVLIVSPEYNRSIPGPLKNAVDWASRPYGKNALAHKLTSLIGTSQGGIGTACAQQALKPVLLYLDTKLMGQPEVYFQFKDGAIDDHGNIADEKSKAFLSGYVDKFTTWVESNQA